MQSTRRFEMGMPLFSGLDLGVILEAKTRLEQGEARGLSSLIEALGNAGKLQTIRRLAAIWTATDTELKTAETNPSVMAELVELAAQRPFPEAFKDAMAFQSALWESLGVSPASSEPTESTEKARGKKRKTSAASQSGG